MKNKKAGRTWVYKSGVFNLPKTLTNFAVQEKNIQLVFPHAEKEYFRIPQSIRLKGELRFASFQLIIQAKLNETMTRASDQQKKQRQKEFKERKEHQELLKAMAKKTKQDKSGNDGANKAPKVED